mgnify:FL=1
MLGTSIFECTLKNVIVQDSNGLYLNIGSSKIENTSFITSNLKEMRLIGCTEKNLVFSNCRLDKMTISDTKLQGVDLSTNEINGMIFKASDIKGSFISPEQAVSLISNFGLIVKY